MRITLDTAQRKTVLRWLKNGTVTFELIGDLCDFHKMILGGGNVTMQLDREGKIMLLRWLQNGVIYTDDIAALFPTFEELLKETGTINDEN